MSLNRVIMRVLIMFYSMQMDLYLQHDLHCKYSGEGIVKITKNLRRET